MTLALHPALWFGGDILNPSHFIDYKSITNMHTNIHTSIDTSRHTEIQIAWFGIETNTNYLLCNPSAIQSRKTFMLWSSLVFCPCAWVARLRRWCRHRSRLGSSTIGMNSSSSSHSWKSLSSNILSNVIMYSHACWNNLTLFWWWIRGHV